MRLWALHCGWLTGPLGAFLEGEHGHIRAPVPSFLIDHPDGVVLFDSGMHADAYTDPEGRLGPMVTKIYTVERRPDDRVGARLAELGIDPARVRYLVNSHLHFDHSGGNHQVPNARLLVQRREWEAGHDADLAAANYFDRRDYDLGHDVQLVDGEHDLFGDGRVVCVPTYGHTPGHQSLRVRGKREEVILAADSCYLRRTLESLHLPPIVHDRDAMLQSLATLRTLQARGARIFYGHDPEFWATVPQAPAAVL